jgi:hypothetical protein
LIEKLALELKQLLEAASVEQDSKKLHAFMDRVLYLMDKLDEERKSQMNPPNC